MAKESITAQPAGASNIASLSFEAAVAELETIVRRLEAGQGELEAAIADYTRGTELKNHCVAKLEAAKLQLDTIIKGADGNLSLQPAKLPE